MGKFEQRAEELGHKLQRDEDGDIDVFAVDSGFHNGPACEACRDSWCHHCTSADELKPCPGAAEYEAALEKRERAELARLKAKYDQLFDRDDACDDSEPVWVRDEGNELEPIYRAQDSAHEARYEPRD